MIDCTEPCVFRRGCFDTLLDNLLDEWIPSRTVNSANHQLNFSLELNL